MKFDSKFVKLFVGALFSVLLVVGLTIKPGWASLGGATTDSMSATSGAQQPHSLNYVQNYGALQKLQQYQGEAANTLYAQGEFTPMEEFTVEEELAPPPECSDENIYYLPNPSDCGSFYQCSNGRAILMPCGEGTEWDDELQVCNWFEEASCSPTFRPALDAIVAEMCSTAPDGTEWTNADLYPRRLWYECEGGNAYSHACYRWGDYNYTRPNDRPDSLGVNADRECCDLSTGECLSDLGTIATNDRDTPSSPGALVTP